MQLFRPRKTKTAAAPIDPCAETVREPPSRDEPGLAAVLSDSGRRSGENVDRERAPVREAAPAPC